jgi:hypothetical protein
MATLDPRNVIINNPRDIDFLGIDASPIYLTIDASVSVGATSYSIDAYDYVVDAASHNFTQLTREPLFDLSSGGGIFYENNEITGYGESSFFDGLNDLFFGSSGGGKFAAGLLYVDGIYSGRAYPFSPPDFFTPSGTGYQSHTFSDIVTETDTGGTPPVDVLRDVTVSVSVPQFTGALRDGDLKMVITFSGSVSGTHSGVSSVTDTVEIDASAWDSPDFRDIRGTYGATSYDPNGIEYVWSVTIG